MSDTLETYVVHAKTDGSTVSIGTNDPVDALNRARNMVSSKSAITISDRDGNLHTIQELEAAINAGKYAKPASSV